MGFYVSDEGAVQQARRDPRLFVRQKASISGRLRKWAVINKANVRLVELTAADLYACSLRSGAACEPALMANDIKLNFDLCCR
jgi:hypothetical protein